MNLTLEDCTVARAVFLWAAKRRHPTGDGTPFNWRMHNHYMRNVIRLERWLIACFGKHPFDSYRNAERAANRPHNGEPYVVYRCRFCRAFHLGNPAPEVRRARARVLAKRAEVEHARD